MAAHFFGCRLLILGCCCYAVWIGFNVRRVCDDNTILPPLPSRRRPPLTTVCFGFAVFASPCTRGSLFPIVNNALEWHHISSPAKQLNSANCMRAAAKLAESTLASEKVRLARLLLQMHSDKAAARWPVWRTHKSLHA